MTTSRTENLGSLGLLILRLGVGGFMAGHGWGKAMMVVEYFRTGALEHWKDPFGVSDVGSLILAAGAEFVCSLLVVLGLATRFAAAPVVITMAVAAFVVHRADPLSSETAAKAFLAGTSKSWAAKEFPLLFLIPFLTLVFTGGGRFSLDAVLWSKRKPQTGTGAA